MIEKLFELNICPVPSTEPDGIAFIVADMVVHTVGNSVLDHPIEDFKPAFDLTFCGGNIGVATEHLLDDVSVDFAIVSEQYLECIKLSKYARIAQ